MTRLNHRSNPKALELLRQQQAVPAKQSTNVANSAPAHTPHAVPLKAGVSHVTKATSAKTHPPLSLPADKAKEVKSLDSRLQAAQKQLRDIERHVSADNGRATRELKSAEALAQQVANGAASSAQASPEPTAISVAESNDIAVSESPKFEFPNAVKEANDEFAKMFSGAFKLDSMMEQAFKLMNSESQADQLKGQFMLQKAQRLFELISSAIRSMGEMQKTAIGNIR